MSTETSTPVVAPTKAEQRAADQRSKREAKAQANAERKAANAAKRQDGVIGTLHQALLNPTGTSKTEIIGVLTVKFPDRDPIGMTTTVGIQLSRLQAKHGKIVSRKIDGRGLVYGYQSTVQFPVEGSQGVAAPAAPVEVTAPVAPTPAKPAQVVRRPGGKKQ